MHPCRSQRNLRGSSAAASETKAEKTPKSDNWQLKVLVVRGPRQDCWLMDSAADIHICNNRRLMTDFTEKQTRVGGSTTNGVSPGRGTVWIRLVLKDKSKGVIINLWDIYHLSNSLLNLISLDPFNDISILYDNKRYNFYNKLIRKPLGFAQWWEQSFLLHPLNLSVLATKLLKIGKNTYQDVEPKVHQTQSKNFPLIVRYKCLRHLNFLALKKYLTYHNICYNDNKYICDSCERVKPTKCYNSIP